jgi:hypothetical protein
LKKDGCWGASERPPTAFVLSPRPRRIPRLHFALAGEDSAPPFSPGRAFPDVFPPSALNLWPAWRGNPHLGGSNIRVPGPGELVSRTIRGWTPCFRPGPGCALSASRSCRRGSVGAPSAIVAPRQCVAWPLPSPIGLSVRTGPDAHRGGTPLVPSPLPMGSTLRVGGHEAPQDRCSEWTGVGMRAAYATARIGSNAADGGGRASGRPAGGCRGADVRLSAPCMGLCDPGIPGSGRRGDHQIHILARSRDRKRNKGSI